MISASMKNLYDARQALLDKYNTAPFAHELLIRTSNTFLPG
jgi:hypothetical protein